MRWLHIINYQTLGIVPQFGTFVPGWLYIKGKEIQNRALRGVLNDYQTSYQNLLNVVYHLTLFMCPIWKLLLLKFLNAWITSIPQDKNQGRSWSAVCPKCITWWLNIMCLFIFYPQWTKLSVCGICSRHYLHRVFRQLIYICVHQAVHMGWGWWQSNLPFLTQQ